MRHLVEEATFAADRIVVDRQAQYGDGWRYCDLIFLIDRACEKSLAVRNAYLASSDEALEEALDAINYLRFAWCRMKEAQE